MRQLAALAHAMSVGVDLPGLAHFNDSRTTAQLRSAARDAAGTGHYREAAELFDLAADRYPDRQGALGACDIARLRSEAKACRAIVASLVSA